MADKGKHSTVARAGKTVYVARDKSGRFKVVKAVFTQQAARKPAEVRKLFASIERDSKSGRFSDRLSSPGDQPAACPE